MAPIIRAGAESRHPPGSTALNIEDIGYATPDTNVPQIDTAGPVHWRSKAAWKMNQSLSRVRWTWSGATGRHYWSRTYLYIDAAALTGILSILEWQTNAGASLAKIRLDTNLTLVVVDGSNTVLGTSAVLSTGTWYCVETHLMINAAAAADDTYEVRVYTGDTLASPTAPFYSSTAVTLGTVAPARFAMGPGTLSGTVTLHFDDMGINDDQGANENTWVGPGSIVYCMPTSDQARVGWTAGAGATSNLWDAEDNRPPVGVALASATNTSQVVNGNANNTDTLDLNLQTPGVAGVGAGEVIRLAQARAVGGNSSTAAMSLGVQMLSNPTIAESSQGLGAIAAATFPTGWTGDVWSVYSFGPSVDSGTAPVLRLRKGTASADSVMSCMAALMLEVGPAAVGGKAPPGRSHRGRRRKHLLAR